MDHESKFYGNKHCLELQYCTQFIHTYCYEFCIFGKYEICRFVLTVLKFLILLNVNPNLRKKSSNSYYEELKMKNKNLHSKFAQAKLFKKIRKIETLKL